VKRRTSLLVFVAAFVVAATAVSAHATAPGRNGRIAFRRYFNSDQTRGAIFTIKPAGTAERQLTQAPHGIVHTSPDWSPDGRWITYTREWADHPQHIFRIHPNGTGREDLSEATCQPDDCLGDLLSSYSPDGTQIAFIRVLGPEHSVQLPVFLMQADGTDIVQVTDPGTERYQDFAPRWSPDGTRLVFSRYDGQRDKDAIFTVSVDGTDLRRVTRWRMNCAQNPDWSPNGRWIVTACHPVEEVNLWLVHPDGSGLHRITHSPGARINWGVAGFSPNGKRIVAGRFPKDSNPDVYVMTLRGGQLRNVTHSPAWDSVPDWGPRPQ
jgi:TolB protein